MLFNWRHLFRQAFNSVFCTKGSHRQLTGHRMAVLIIFWVLFIPHQIITHICLALDNVFFPGWRRVKIEKPCFITGLFRSGTTYLHRLLAKDEKIFTTFLTWEIYIAPSIIQRKFMYAWKKLDRLLGSPAMRLLKGYDRKSLAAVKFHEVGLWKGEEDEGLFLYLWDSLFTWFFFPDIRGVSLFARDIPDIKKLDRKFQFYASCVKRHLYCHPQSYVYLSKNPAFTPQLEALKRNFPDARIIYLFRDPAKVLVSQSAWFAFCWHYFCTPKEPYPFKNEILEMTENWYKYSLNLFREWNHSDVLIIQYEDLISNTLQTIEKLYRYCNLELSAETLKILSQEIQNSSDHGTAGNITFRDIGFDEEEMKQRFDGIDISDLI